jgi:outer membrane protein OmpA-like peptidoglycan-associated protein
VIQFDPNQSEPAPTVKSSLERIGKTLEVYPLQKVRITGFAMTSENSAETLAVKRAETVRLILVEEYHVDVRRVIVAGGKTSTAENASKVELSITN